MQICLKFIRHLQRQITFSQYVKQLSLLKSTGGGVWKGK